VTRPVPPPEGRGGPPRQSKRLERRFRGLLEAAPDAMLITDAAGRIVLVNAHAERLFGYARQELVGQAIEILVPARFRERHVSHRAKYGDAPRVREMGAGLELYGVKKDGSEFPVEISLSPLRTDEGMLVTSAIRDVTRQKEEARRIGELAARAMEASRLKSEFLANMSHELRTPLNAVIGFTELLHDGKAGPVSAEQKEFLADILSSSRHLLQLINDVLDLSKVEAGKLEFRPEAVDMSRLVAEVRDILRSIAAAKRIRVRVEIDPALGEVVIDPGKLKQVLYNYLSNALKFTPDGGQVWLRVVPEGTEDFRLEVEDTGIGIGPPDLERLFVEFQQLDATSTKKYAGTGLGLALTKRLVEAQGGRIGARSVPGEGSVFLAVLPRRAEPRPPRPAEPPAEAATGGPAVLVVEDDERERQWLVATLTRAGYRVDTAVTGGEAIARLRDRRYDALTLDVLLPDGDGRGVLETLRQGGPNAGVPVVVVTVVAEAGVFSGYGVHEVLSKPVAEKDLLSALARADVSARAAANE
jgi:PAS domain S-box-containing protein